MTTWFGYTAHAEPNVLIGNFVYAQKVTCTITGSVNFARCWIDHTTASSKMKLALYSIVGGVPTALLGVSDELTIPSGVAAGLQTFTFSTPVPVVNGTDYALAWNSNAGANVIWDGMQTVGGLAYYYAASAYPAFPNPLAGTGTTGVAFAQEAGVGLNVPSGPTLLECKAGDESVDSDDFNVVIDAIYAKNSLFSTLALKAGGGSVDTVRYNAAVDALFVLSGNTAHRTLKAGAGSVPNDNFNALVDAVNALP